LNNYSIDKIYENYINTTMVMENTCVFNNTNQIVNSYYNNNNNNNTIMYTRAINDIDEVIKIKNNKANENHIDIVKLKSNNTKLDKIIYDTLERFDLSCCKVAFTYNKDNDFTFYINTDYYNNKAYVDSNDIFKASATLKRVEKYKNKGVQNIEIIKL